MQTATITTFTFDELDGSAKDKARQWAFPDWEWWDSTFDYWKTELLKERGYYDAELNFSGFYVQGSGASIQAGVHIVEWIENGGQQADYPLILRFQDCLEIYMSVRHGRDPHWIGMYVDETYPMIAYADDDLTDDLEIQLEAEIEQVRESILDDAKELAKKLFRELESEYDYMCSDEYISEFCEANGYVFDETGRPIHHLID